MFGYPPYYPPPYQPSQDPIVEAERFIKKLKKAQKKATEEEALKHKDKISKPKPGNVFSKLDVLHAMLGMFLFMLFVGPFIGLAQVMALKHYMEALNALFK